ncbi:hypothetical protein BKI52_28270 [marine bacterium AO1-C]|nr:hypothetical protein BKI52_28270 [marine bacterium AO1-C]
MTIFPADHPLNQDISQKAIDPNSSAILTNIGLTQGLFPDFGSGTFNGSIIGIPYVVVCSNQPEVEVVFRANSYDGNYGDESDQGPFPIPLDAPIEGNGVGDSHVIAVDVENGILYELYNASVNGNTWEASSAAKFDLKTTEFRTDGWTSADAAGLPIWPCLVRYEEIEKGVIDHPIRFTLARSKIGRYVHPARHLVNTTQADNQLPFGGILRLKADFDISGYSKTNQVILTAMKKYGIILADVGSSMFISGAPDERWGNDDLKQLRQVKVSDFDVIELGTIK